MSLTLSAVLGSVLVMLGARFLLVGQLGVDVPFYDQWGAEGGLLYFPWVEDRFRASILLSLHNEHRILTTRLLHLALFIANGAWDTRLQMTVNGGIHAVAIVGWALALGRGLSDRARLLLFAAGTAIVAVPFGWENALAGFQAQFYLSLLFQTAALSLLLTRRPFDVGWFAALPLLALGFLSLASGFLAAPAAAAIYLLEVSTRRSASVRVLSAAAVLIALSALCFYLTPSLPWHAHLRAQSPSEFALALGKALAWPWPEHPALAFAIHAPWIATALCFAFCGERWRVARLPLGFGVWVLLQAAAISYARGAGGIAPTSRYLDLLAPGLLVEVTCLALGIGLVAAQTPRRWVKGAAAAWMTLVVVGGAVGLPNDLARAAERSEQNRLQAGTVRAFLRTGDERLILDAEPSTLPVPLPLAESLLEGLRNPGFVAVLPRGVRPPASAGERSGVPASQPRLSPVSEWLLAHGWIVIVAGTLFFGAALTRLRSLGAPRDT